MKFLFKYIIIYFSCTFILNAKMNNNDIENLVKNYLRANNINQDFSINEKLRLPSCNGKIDIENKYGNYKTLLIKCLDDNKWQYNLRTNIKFLKKKMPNKEKKDTGKSVYVLKVDLKKNHILDNNNIIRKNIRNLGSNNYFLSKTELIGRKLKIPLKAGQIIRERHLIKNWTIKEGQNVIIENNRSKISIMVAGIATKSAMKGDYLDVLNKSSGKIVKAWVINSKKVSIFR